MTVASMRRGGWRARGHAGWWAFALHRVSGLALAIFLPVHFLVLGAALNGAPVLDGALEWTEQPWVKASEIAIVFLLRRSPGRWIAAAAGRVSSAGGRRRSRR